MVFKDHRRCDLEPEPLWVGGCVPSWWFLRSPDLPQQMQHRLYEQKVRQHDLRAALSDSKWVEIWNVWETSQDFKVRFSKAMGSTDVWNLQSKKYIDSQGVVLLIYPRVQRNRTASWNLRLIVSSHKNQGEKMHKKIQDVQSQPACFSRCELVVEIRAL